MVVRALQLWRENENRWGRQLFYRTGVLWMTQKDDSFEKGSVPVLRDAGLTFETLKPDDLAKRFPQINLEGITWAIYEPDAGYLRARYACETVLKAFLDEGGKYRTASAKPGRMEGERLRSVILSDGSELQADQYVFACGPWLGKLFPDVIGDQLEPTRQEIFFFGIPAGDTSYSDEHMPTWVDHGERYWYGIAGNQWRGFKVADDTRGPRVDPTHLERVATQQGLRAARAYMEFRFPGLKGAPLLESRVCQYENTPKHDFIVDRHPSARNLLLLGGGSGHGFKHGPALGEYAADVLLGNKAPEPLFQLSRLKGT
jgi:glycine/D-amino acid oxidase-like deaminating enzyme